MALHSQLTCFALGSRVGGRVGEGFHLPRGSVLPVKCVKPRRRRALWEELEGGVGFQDGRPVLRRARGRPTPKAAEAGPPPFPSHSRAFIIQGQGSWCTGRAFPSPGVHCDTPGRVHPLSGRAKEVPTVFPWWWWCVCGGDPDPQGAPPPSVLELCIEVWLALNHLLGKPR